MSGSDVTLLDRWTRRGDSEAFNELVRRHGAMVHGAARRILRNDNDAEEIAQEIFFKLSRAKGNAPNSVAAWLHRVATNAALDRIRKDSRRRDREKGYADLQPAQVDEPEWKDIEPHIDAAIAELPDDVREAVVLHFMEGLTHQEIADRAGITRSAASRRAKRGVDGIRTYLNKRNITITAAALASMLEAHALAAPTTGLLLATLGKSALTSAVARPTSAVLSFKALTTLVAIVVLGIGGLFTARSFSPTPAAETTTDATPSPAPTAAENGPTPLTDEAPSAPDDVVADVTQPMYFEVHCVNESGSPIEGVDVYSIHYWREDAAAWDEPARRDYSRPYPTDNDGSVQIPVPENFGPKGKMLTFFAYGPGMLLGGVRVGTFRRSLDELLEETYTITMQGVRTISGRVITPEDYDPSQVELYVQEVRLDGGRFGTSLPLLNEPGDTAPPAIYRIRPARDGTFTLRDMPVAGAPLLYAGGPGLGEVRMNGYSHRIEDGFEFVMQREAAIEGYVKDSAGNPVPGVNVLAHPGHRGPIRLASTSPFRTTTDTTGFYHINGLPDTTYAIRASSLMVRPDHIAAVLPEVEVEPGLVTLDQNLVLEPGSIYEGVVTDEETGKPIPDVWLTALNPADPNAPGSSGPMIGHSRTGEDGRYSLRLPTGTSQVYISDPAVGLYQHLEDNGKEFVTVDGSARVIQGRHYELKPVEARTYGKARLKGLVVDPLGEPIPNVSLYYDHNPPEDDGKFSYGNIHLGKSDEDGRYDIELTAYGRVRMTVGGGRYSVAESEWIQLLDDEGHEVETLTIRRFKEELSGYLVDSDGNPLGGVYYSMDHKEYFSAINQQTDVDGHFDFGWVPEGPFDIYFIIDEKHEVFFVEKPTTGITVQLEGGL